MSVDGRGKAEIPSGNARPAFPEEKPPKSLAQTRFRLHTGGKGLAFGTAKNVHASCVVVGESGILIRGPSGAGKTTLATLLIAQARIVGEFAAWVGDDRVLVSHRANRLVGAPHPAIAGRYEARGLGISSGPHEPSAVLRLLVDLKDYTERLPERNEFTAIIAGVTLPRVPLVAGRIGMYEASLVVSLTRMRQESESRPTSGSRVGTVGI